MNVFPGNAPARATRIPPVGTSAPRTAALRVRRLAASLALVLAVPIGVVGVFATASPATPHQSATGAQDQPLPPIPVPVTWIVKNCNDDGADSLRHVITSDAHTGDTVDLGQLPTLCGMTDSTITLTSGQIIATQDDLILRGPMRDR